MLRESIESLHLARKHYKSYKGAVIGAEVLNTDVIVLQLRKKVKEEKKDGGKEKKKKTRRANDSFFFLFFFFLLSLALLTESIGLSIYKVKNDTGQHVGLFLEIIIMVKTVFLLLRFLLVYI